MFLPILKTMTIKKCFFNSPGPKWQIIKVHQLPNYDRVSFCTDLTYTPVHSTIVFILHSHLKQDVPQNGLTKSFFKNGDIQFWIGSTFWGDTLFEMVNGERKAIVQFKVCTWGQPCSIWQPVKVRKQVIYSWWEYIVDISIHSNILRCSGTIFNQNMVNLWFSQTFFNTPNQTVCLSLKKSLLLGSFFLCLYPLPHHCCTFTVKLVKIN